MTTPEPRDSVAIRCAPQNSAIFAVLQDNLGISARFPLQVFGPRQKHKAGLVHGAFTHRRPYSNAVSLRGNGMRFVSLL